MGLGLGLGLGVVVAAESAALTTTVFRGIVTTTSGRPPPPVGAPVERDLDQLTTSQLLSVAARALSTTARTPLRVLGLPPVGLYALEYLAERGALLQIDLARLLYVRPQTAGNLLNRLERQGFISRRPSGDRNHITVTITEDGRAILLRARGCLPAGTSSAPSHLSATPNKLPAIVLNNDQGLRDALEALRPVLCAIITDLDSNHPAQPPPGSCGGGKEQRNPIH